MKRWTMAFAPLLFLDLLAACMPGTTAPQTMEVVLEGENEVPPVTTDAFGSANVTVAGTAMTVDGAFAGFQVTAAHVHGPADVGETAGPIFTLAVDNADTHFEGTFTMTAEEVGWFEEGLLYINLHSDANPNGEIRGQIVPWVERRSRSRMSVGALCGGRPRFARRIVDHVRHAPVSVRASCRHRRWRSRWKTWTCPVTSAVRTPASISIRSTSRQRVGETGTPSMSCRQTLIGPPRSSLGRILAWSSIEATVRRWYENGTKPKRKIRERTVAPSRHGSVRPRGAARDQG